MKDIRLTTIFAVQFACILILVSYGITIAFNPDTLWGWPGWMVLIISCAIILILEVYYAKTYSCWYNITKVKLADVFIPLAGLVGVAICDFRFGVEFDAAGGLASIGAWYILGARILRQWKFAKDFNLQDREKNLHRFIKECPKAEKLLNPERKQEILREENGYIPVKRLSFRRFISFEQLEYESVPEGATQLIESRSVKQLYIKCIPYFIICIIAIILLGKHHYNAAGIMYIPGCSIRVLLIGLFLTAAGVVLHEILHAVLFPKEDTVYIYNAIKKGLMFCYYKKPIRRGRFILISLFPGIVLGVVPLVIWLLIPAMEAGAYEMIRIFAMIMILGSAGDYLNVKNVLIQTPGKAYIQMKGWDTYWFITENRK